MRGKTERPPRPPSLSPAAATQLERGHGGRREGGGGGSQYVDRNPARRIDEFARFDSINGHLLGFIFCKKKPDTCVRVLSRLNMTGKNTRDSSTPFALRVGQPGIDFVGRGFKILRTMALVLSRFQGVVKGSQQLCFSHYKAYFSASLPLFCMRSIFTVKSPAIGEVEARRRRPRFVVLSSLFARQTACFNQDALHVSFRRGKRDFLYGWAPACKINGGGSLVFRSNTGTNSAVRWTSWCCVCP